MKAKLKPTFRASVDAGTLELDIYESIGLDYWSGGGCTAKSVKQALTEAGAISRITLRINSPGGDAFEGVAIANLVRAQKKPVDVYVDGIAASAASIIAMAGDTITMGLSAMMMVHNAWTWCAGDSNDMRKMADTLDSINGAMADSYMAKSGKTKAEILAIMDAETWMDAQECVDQGFATAIVGEDDDEAQMALAKSFKALQKMKRVPEKLRSKPPKAQVECTCTCGNCAQGDCANCTVDGCDYELGTPCDCGAAVKDDEDEMEASSNLTQYEARLKLLQL